MRVYVHEVLTTRCGWTEQDARERGKNVSHYYDNHIRPTKAPKDAQGVAIYDESDIAGLMEAARNLKAGKTSASSYTKPTRFAGHSSEDMGF
ncbi:hypothetical protein [Actinoplanes sp. NPDC049118]|uniref:hypothetical protein n=1 Tax=Actinoplanes sp. NPDC049118 TaxID=3155769 RepID=UPI0033CBDB3A